MLIYAMYYILFKVTFLVIHKMLYRGGDNQNFLKFKSEFNWRLPQVC